MPRKERGTRDASSSLGGALASPAAPATSAAPTVAVLPEETVAVAAASPILASAATDHHPQVITTIPAWDMV